MKKLYDPLLGGPATILLALLITLIVSYLLFISFPLYAPYLFSSIYQTYPSSMNTLIEENIDDEIAIGYIIERITHYSDEDQKKLYSRLFISLISEHEEAFRVLVEYIDTYYQDYFIKNRDYFRNVFPYRYTYCGPQEGDMILLKAQDFRYLGGKIENWEVSVIILAAVNPDPDLNKGDRIAPVSGNPQYWGLLPYESIFEAPLPIDAVSCRWDDELQTCYIEEFLFINWYLEQSDEALSFHPENLGINGVGMPSDKTDLCKIDIDLDFYRIIDENEEIEIQA